PGGARQSLGSAARSHASFGFIVQRRARRVAREELDDLLANPVQVRTELLEDLGGDALALADEAEQDVLGSDVVVSELEGLAPRELQHLLGPRRERDVPRGSRLALSDDLLDLGTDRLQRDAHGFQGIRRDPLALVSPAGL